MTRNQIKVEYEKLLSATHSYSRGINMDSATWLLVGAIGLHGLKTGWSSFFGSALLAALSAQQYYIYYQYDTKKNKQQLMLLNQAMIIIPDDDHELISLAQKVNDELGSIFQYTGTVIYFACLCYFLSIFADQLSWAALHL